MVRAWSSVAPIFSSLIMIRASDLCSCQIFWLRNQTTSVSLGKTLVVQVDLWFNHGSPCTTSIFPKYTEDVWFLDQAIWREEHKSEYDLKKPIEECEDPECRDHTVISQIKEQLIEVEEEVENAEVVTTTLNGLLISWEECVP